MSVHKVCVALHIDRNAGARPPSPETWLSTSAFIVTLFASFGNILWAEWHKKDACQAQTPSPEISAALRTGKPWFEMDGTGVSKYYVSTKSTKWASAVRMWRLRNSSVRTPPYFQATCSLIWIFCFKPLPQWYTFLDCCFWYWWCW